MLLYVVRHGVTAWNRLRKVQGRADIPLAEEGVRLAKKTGEALQNVPFDLCFSSPLKEQCRRRSTFWETEKFL